MLSVKRKAKQSRADAQGSAMSDRVWEAYPTPLEGEGFALYHLGGPDDALFLADLITPITLTAVSTVYRYRMPFDFKLSKRVFYQTDAAGAESDDAVNIRVDLIHPNRTPEVEYRKAGVSWEAGGTRLTGDTYMPDGELVLTVDGTANNLLYMSLELEVYGVA